MKTITIATLMLATLAPPAFAQGAPAGDQPFFSGTIPADPAYADRVRDERTAAPAGDQPFFSGSIPTDPALAGTVRLTPEQREAALEEGARSGRNVEGANAPDGKIHGEMGVEVGTGGYRSVYGTAVVPLGENGTAAFSFEDSRSNYRQRRYRPGDR